MDAAITGLIGTLGGVVLGAGTQALQATRSRRWQVEDQDVVQANQHRATLWQDRRAAYAALMDAMIELINKHHWAWLQAVSSAKDSNQTPDAAQDTAQAKDALSVSLDAVMRRCETVRLIGGSAEVRDAASNFVTAMMPLSPIRYDSCIPFDSGLTSALASAYSQFAEAARRDLGIDPTPADDTDGSGRRRIATARGDHEN